MDTDIGLIQRFKTSLQSQSRLHEPWATGTTLLTDQEAALAFRCKDGSSRFVSVKSITEADIEALINSCDEEPFGRGPENGLDPSYRCAWKMDDGNFVWRFNPDVGTFVSMLAEGLWPWEEIWKGISVEPYKLNVNGKGGFFKVHADTPRCANMFGSLVVLLPTTHEGGNLILRHGDRQLDFSDKMFQSAPPGSIAWAAFHSDVEHEVLEVTNGARITITSNLYFDANRGPPNYPPEPMKVPPNSFSTLLRGAFRDADFIRRHAYIGFGLEQGYPKTYNSKIDLREVGAYLKGPDAFLFHILTQRSRRCRFNVLVSKPIDGRDERETREDISDMYGTQLQYLMDEDKEAKIVWEEGWSESRLESEEDKEDEDLHKFENAYFHPKHIKEYRERTIKVDWVVNPTTNLAGKTKLRPCGTDYNAPFQEQFYYRVCIIVNVDQAPCPALE